MVERIFFRHCKGSSFDIAQALQIAGRAGRFGTHYEEWEVTTFRPEDLNTLKDILAKPIDPIEVSTVGRY
jgi:hypothetical protein